MYGHCTTLSMEIVWKYFEIIWKVEVISVNMTDIMLDIALLNILYNA